MYSILIHLYFFGILYATIFLNILAMSPPGWKLEWT